MWVAMMAWRKEWQVDSMLDHRVLSEDRQRRLIQVFPHGLHGVDNKVRASCVASRLRQLWLSWWLHWCLAPESFWCLL